MFKCFEINNVRLYLDVLLIKNRVQRYNILLNYANIMVIMTSFSFILTKNTPFSIVFYRFMCNFALDFGKILFI